MKIFKYFVAILLTLPVLLLFQKQAEAAEFHFKSYTLKKEETVKDDVYAIGDTVKIDGVVDGDLIVLAENIQINGTITGDTYLLGSTVNIDAKIMGSSVILSNTSNIKGITSENMYIFSTYTTYDAQTGKDIFSMSLENTFKGSAGDDLRAYSLKSNIDTNVSGDLILLGSEYTVSEEKISKNIYYNSTINTIAREQGIDIENGFKFDNPVKKINIQNDWTFIVLKTLGSFIAFSIVGVIIITLTPIKNVEISKKITGSTDDFLKSLATGFAAFLLLPLPIFILAITLIGFPAAILISGMIFVAMYFGRVWVELALGQEILELFGKKEYRPYKSFFIGRIISVAINLIPVVRGFYNTIISLVALGAIIRMKKSYFNIASKKNRK